MRILYLNSGNLFGGIETLLLTLAKHRKECPAMEPEFGVCFLGRFSEALEAEGVPVHHLGAARMSQPWKVLLARRRLSKLLRQRRPQAVICHGSWSLALLGPAVRRQKIPIVYWTHDRVTEPLPWQERWAKLCRPNYLVANSLYTAAGQTALFPDVPSRVIYCALSPPMRRPGPAERDDFRRSLNTPANDTVILQISRLDPHKGHLLHLEALSRLARLPWTAWIVAGPQRPAEAALLENLKRRAEELGIASRIRWLGWQKDVELVYEAADIFCQPNQGAEPFGLTFVEALWRSKPVVTTAMAGALEVVSADCGILTPPGDAAALAQALQELIQDPVRRQSLGRAGPARASLLCDPGSRLAEIHTLLGELTVESQ